MDAGGEQVLERNGLGKSAAAAALTSKGSCVSVVSGRYDEALRLYTVLATSKEADLVSRTIGMGNTAAGNCEIGRLDRALQYGSTALKNVSLLGLA